LFGLLTFDARKPQLRDGFEMTVPIWLPTRAMRGLIEATNDAIIITTASDLDRPGPRIVYVNPAFTALSGYRADEAVGGCPRMLQGPGTDRRASGRIRAALTAGQPAREELLNYTKHGDAYWLDIAIVPLIGDDGSIEYFGAIERDVTDQRLYSDRLERLAHEDVLTGIGNRAALQRHMAALVQEGDAAETVPYFLLIDLDGFKAINDSLGHQAGDRILQCFAAHAVSHMRRDDFIVRLGGDEFVLILDGYTRDEALRLAERIVATLSSMPAEGAAQVGASIGLTAFARREGLDAVFARADAALYEAKAAGRGVVRVAAGAVAI